MSILTKCKESDFSELIDLCGFSQMKSELINSYKEHLESHKAKKPLPINHPVGWLDHQWYESLADSPKYAVYTDPFYLCDIWLCWTLYSRNSLKALRTSKVDRLLKDSKTVVDLGCGFGFTTAGLKEIFPEAKVFGTNIKNSFQFRVAKQLGETNNFTVCEDLADVGHADLCFASEYFEHFERPVEHLHEVVTKLKPKALIIANGFNGHAIWHFNIYKHKEACFTNKTASKFFNECLKYYGYRKIKTNIWNNRPSVWMRN